MKIIIEGNPKEIAALVLELQERQVGTLKEDIEEIQQYILCNRKEWIESDKSKKLIRLKGGEK